jgi:hypothetical protein
MDTEPDDALDLDDPETGHRYRRDYDVANRARELRRLRFDMIHGSPAAGRLHLDLAEAIRRELGTSADDPRVKVGVDDALAGRSPRY